MATRTRSKRLQPSNTEDVSASRPSKRGRKQDAVEEEEEEVQLDQENYEDAGRQEALRFSGRPTGEPQAQNEESTATEGRRQLIEGSLPDLASQAHQLISFLSEPADERRQSWRQRLFVVKRDYFNGLRGVFEEPQGFPFINDEKLDFIKFSADDLLKIGYANFATALDIIEQILIKDGVSTLEHLAQLDGFLHKLYSPFQQGDMIDTSLDIRTLLFIKQYEEESDTSKTPIKMNKLQELLASCFCEPSVLDGKVNYPSLFINGPFRPIGHSQGDDPDVMCERRIKTILDIWKKAGKGAALPRLQEAFPLSEKLEELRTHILTVYESSKEDEVVTSQPQEQFHDAREDADDLESVIESQPIVRASTQGQSFFTPESLAVLQSGAGPSETQQAAVDDSNSAILGPRPASVAPSTIAGASRSVLPDMPHRQRAPAASEAPLEEDEDEDEDDSFEEDSRSVNKGKAAAVRETLNARPTSPPPPSGPSSSMPPPPRPSAQQPPPSSAFERMRDEKHRTAAQYRSSLPPSSDSSGKQRHAWSEKDQFTLIDLIAKCYASWSKIEGNYGHLFERRRNQQAYRDKARNMKVDFLWTDRVLPPKFDMVRLSQKEIQKLEAVGKNPHRMERDLDDEGTPINTEIPR